MKVKWECIKNTYPHDTAGAIGSKAKSKIKTNLSITLKTVSKNYTKKLIANSNPTYGTKNCNAGHVKTGQIKVLILLPYFFGLVLG